MTRKYPNMSKLKAGKRVRFRNGGVSKIHVIDHSAGSKFYPIHIRLKSFHASCMQPWCYDERGFCGEQTGPGNQCPFDIMEILK